MTKITITKPAGFDDIYHELVKRGIIVEKPVWTTKEGKEIPLSEMTDNHLLNVYHLFEKMKEDEYLYDHLCDMDPLEYYD